MTPVDVAQRVKDIEASVGDDESAHSLEDELRRDLLEAIAEGRCTSPGHCARIALRTEKLDFRRWCA